MISVLGAVFVLLVGYALLFRRRLLPWTLSAAVPFTASAGFTVAGQSIVVYHVVAVVVVAVVLHRHRLQGILRSDASAKPGLRPLVAFGAWALAVTAIVPTAFAGLPVLDPRVGIDDGVKAPAELAPSISNLAQSGYLLIGIATVVAIAAIGNVSPRLPTAAFAGGTVLSSVKTVLPDSAQKLLFDNSANVSYTAGEFDGIERMRGVFSEPSVLGAFSVAAMVFFAMTAAQSRATPRFLYSGLALWALVNAILSFSGGAIVSGLIVLVAVVAQRAYVYLRGRVRLSPAAVAAFFALAPIMLIVGPTIQSFVSALLDDKTGSSSYENRNAADAFSYVLTRQTVWLGAGVGSNRPSSFLASLLSTTGVVGTALFAGALVLVIVRAARDPRYRPTVAALIAIVVSKLVSGPDVSEPPMWFLLGLCAAAAWNPRRPPDGRDGRARSLTLVRDDDPRPSSPRLVRGGPR